MIKWDLKEKFDAKADRFEEVIGRYNKSMIEASTHLADCKAEQEAILRKEFQTGDDLSAEKAVILVKIAQAEAAKETAALEHRKANDFAREASIVDQVTLRDLVVNWNGPYLTEVRTKELQPIVDRMREARDAYYNAVLDIYELEKAYEYSHFDLSQREIANKRPGDGIYVHKVVEYRNVLPLITDKDLFDITKYSALPNGIKRIKNGGAK